MAVAAEVPVVPEAAINETPAPTLSLKLARDIRAAEHEDDAAKALTDGFLAAWRRGVDASLMAVHRMLNHAGDARECPENQCWFLGDMYRRGTP